MTGYTTTMSTNKPTESTHHADMSNERAEIDMSTNTTDTDSAERELFVSWLSGSYPHAWPRWEAENAWRNNHVSALAWRYCRASSAAAVPAKPVAHLWQHTETGRTRIVMPDQIITADATWVIVGPLYLAATPAPPQADHFRDYCDK